MNEERVRHFQLIETAHGSHRPKRMAVTDPAERIQLQAPLGLQVIFARTLWLKWGGPCLHRTLWLEVIFGRTLCLDSHTHRLKIFFPMPLA